MIKFKEIKEKSAKKNQKELNRVFYFSSKFSVHLSYIFINFGLSPNQVTFLFFLFGLGGALMLCSTAPWVVLVAYLLYRLHIIIDLCDGEVARFTKLFSLNGAYYDYMIHAVLYPLYFGMMCYGQFLEWNDHNFLLLAGFGVLIVSLTQAVKNNYFRAMLFDGKSIDEYKTKSKSKNSLTLKNQLYIIITDLLSFEGLFLGYILAILIDSKKFSYLLLIGFALSFTMMFLLKFYLFSKNGAYKSKVG